LSLYDQINVPGAVGKFGRNANGLRVAVLEKFGVGHGEPFLDVHVHLDPGGNECKAKYPVDQASSAPPKCKGPLGSVRLTT
jgi:hypothetical protein